MTLNVLLCQNILIWENYFIVEVKKGKFLSFNFFSSFLSGLLNKKSVFRLASTWRQSSNNITANLSCLVWNFLILPTRHLKLFHIWRQVLVFSITFVPVLLAITYGEDDLWPWHRKERFLQSPGVVCSSVRSIGTQ